MNSLPPASGFLLAGGRSSRMGTNKALLPFRGTKLLVQRGLQKLSRVCAEVAIAGGVPELAPYGRIIPDEFPGQGPLGGIVSALEQSRTEWNLFLAVDMPVLPVAALRTLLSGTSEGVLVILPQTGEQVQPLCGLYSRDALPTLRRELLLGNRRVRQAVEATGSFRYWPAPLAWFANVNTPEEFAAAEKGTNFVAS